MIVIKQIRSCSGTTGSAAPSAPAAGMPSRLQPPSSGGVAAASTPQAPGASTAAGAAGAIDMDAELAVALAAAAASSDEEHQAAADSELEILSDDDGDDDVPKQSAAKRRRTDAAAAAGAGVQLEQQQDGCPGDEDCPIRLLRVRGLAPRWNTCCFGARLRDVVTGGAPAATSYTYLTARRTSSMLTSHLFGHTVLCTPRQGQGALWQSAGVASAHGACTSCLPHHLPQGQEALSSWPPAEQLAPCCR